MKIYVYLVELKNANCKLIKHDIITRKIEPYGKETKRGSNKVREYYGDIYIAVGFIQEVYITPYGELKSLSRAITPHPTENPLAFLFEYLIKTYTNEGDLVLDNCMGSGLLQGRIV